MLGMLGLEGSGFTICLGVILLLTGVVMYYCKTKITQCEHKVDSMFSLITSMSDEITICKATINQMSNPMPVPQNFTEIQQEEASDDSEDEEEEEINLTETTNIFSNHPYQELIPATIENGDNSEDSESEDDTDEENEEQTTKEIKVVDLGEIEELETHNLEEEIDGSEGSETSVEEEEDIDYSKLQVVALKRLVSERKLSSNVNKLRKAELVELLQSS